MTLPATLPAHGVMGLALAQGTGAHLVVERGDGHTSLTDLRWWLRDPAAPVPADAAALDLLTDAPAGPAGLAGPVLDVGCATGRHLDLLRERGLAAAGIDTCPEAVQLAVGAGHRVQVADVWTYGTHTHTTPSGVPSGGFVAVLALGGNLGIAGRLERLPAFLTRLASFTQPGGTVIVSSLDWRQPAPEHQGFLDQQRASGVYPGQVRLRLRLEEHTSRWFDWLWVDPDTLTTVATDTGMRTEEIVSWGAKYAARLTIAGEQR